MFDYLKAWVDQLERNTQRNEEEKTNFNLIEAQKCLSNYFTHSLPSQYDTVQKNEGERRSEQKLYIGLSSTSVLSKIKYLNMVLGQELLDEEFFSVKRELLFISYNEKIIVNGHQCYTINETQNYMKSFRSTTAVIHLKFPVKFYEMLSEKARKRIFLLDNFTEIKQDLKQLNLKYILLEKNLDLQLDLWMSIQKAYSEFGISMDTVTGEIVSERNQTLNLVSLIISSETCTAKPESTQIIKNLSISKNKDKRRTLANSSNVSFIGNLKSINKNKKQLKKQNLYQRDFQSECFETLELPLNQVDCDYKMPFVKLPIENYCQCDSIKQFWKYYKEFQHHSCLINNNKEQKLSKNQYQLNLMIEENEEMLDDTIRKKTCLNEVLKVADFHLN